MLVDALHRFCATLQLDESVVKHADQVDGYALSVMTTAGQLKRASSQEYEALCQAFAEALTLTISDDQDIPILDIALGRLPDDIDHRLEQLTHSSDAVPFTIMLQIDKERLLAELGLHGPYHAVFLFFEQRLHALLTADILTQDTVLFDAPEQPTLVIVSDAHYLFRGTMLVICGEADAQQEAPTALMGDAQIRLERYYAMVDSSLNWSGFRLRNATPLHYCGEWRAGDPDEIHRLLMRALLRLFILYTANRSVSIAAQPFEAVYANAERALTVQLGDDVPVAKQDATLMALAAWPVDGDGTDRLTVVRSIVARSLDTGDPLANYDGFISDLPRLLQEVQWQYQAFVDGAIDKHFEEVDKVADETAKASTQLADTIDSITKGLSDTLLATIGAVVVSFLAALLANHTPGTIFEIAMKIYALYLVFLVVYRMGSILYGYRLLGSESKVRFARYERQLGVERVAELQEPLKARQRQFRILFSITLILYGALAVMVWWSSTYVPEELARHGLIARPASVTTTTTSPTRPHNQPTTTSSRRSRKYGHP